ncbi:biotin/lipoyl-binding carrier protein [Paenibacillus cymbidii]|uniref:biotin/lipoyl-binding carrier protein n=1 Tax=Paenibacillus cymbidii TaxID=1639034 RepID=UPI0010820EB3|nr:biotin/lipoyl-binding carrier protein [Paenibacillus cymbidii]
MALIHVEAQITGSVWKIEVKPGDRVAEDDTLLIMESMKMEIPLLAPEDGTVKEIVVSEGSVITEGTVAVIIET